MAFILGDPILPDAGGARQIMTGVGPSGQVEDTLP